MRGTVLRIERASIHDGPGLRTVVFLKGCPLRCRWCSTPESQSFQIERGLNRVKCMGCGACVLACPQRAIRLVKAKAVVDNAACDECMECVAACPNDAFIVYGTEMTADSVVKEILKDEVFFYHSGGGVTLSGGEPLAQPDFAGAILRACRDLGVGTAMETSLHASLEDLELVLPYVDHLYVDVKHMHPQSHKQWTCVGNRLILENLCRLDKTGFAGSVVIRIPVVPMANDTEDNLIGTARLAAGISRLSDLELLPYHRMGVGAYQSLGLAYLLEDLEAPTATDLQRLLQSVRTAVPQVPARCAALVEDNSI